MPGEARGKPDASLGDVEWSPFVARTRTVTITMTINVTITITITISITMYVCIYIYIYIYIYIHMCFLPRFYNQITVEESAPYSYFMAGGFAGGYFGIQELIWETENYHVMRWFWAVFRSGDCCLIYVHSKTITRWGKLSTTITSHDSFIFPIIVIRYSYS